MLQEKILKLDDMAAKILNYLMIRELGETRDCVVM